MANYEIVFGPKLEENVIDLMLDYLKLNRDYRVFLIGKLEIFLKKREQVFYQFGQL